MEGPQKDLKRCSWTGDEPLLIEYHDTEWGIPVHDDRALFEMLCLESAQAGLSWLTVLRRRDEYRRAYQGFDPQKVAAFGPDQIDALVSNTGLIRNRAKIMASIGNAQAFLSIQEEVGSFDQFVWRFVDGKPIQNAWRSLADLPAHTERSGAMSAELRHRGFKFVGPTICYAFMQAIGMVNDHLVRCFRYSIIRGTSPV